MEFLKSYGGYDFYIGRYAKPANLALRAMETETGEPYATCSVNLEDLLLPDSEMAIQTHNLRGFEKVLIEAGIIDSTPLFMVSSGFVYVPIYKLLVTLPDGV